MRRPLSLSSTQAGPPRAGTDGPGTALAPVPIRAAGQPLPFTRARRRRRPPAPFPWQAFTCPLAPGLGWPAASALTSRPAISERPPYTVILDLSGSTGVEEQDCAALRWVHGRLAALGSRLWLAAVPAELADPLGEHGVTGLLGRSAIHQSRRAAVLAAYAAVPGPALVTSPVREALTAAAEPLLPGG